MYFFDSLRLKVVFRQKKIKTNQGLRLCCKRFFNSTLLRFSPSVAMQRKVLCRITRGFHFLQTESHHVWHLSKLRQNHQFRTCDCCHRERSCKGRAFSRNSDQRSILQPLFHVVDPRLHSHWLYIRVVSAPEEQWNKLFLDGLTIGKGEIAPDELSAVIKKRIERTLIRTVSSRNLFLQLNMSL